MYARTHTLAGSVFLDQVYVGVKQHASQRKERGNHCCIYRLASKSRHRLSDKHRLHTHYPVMTEFNLLESLYVVKTKVKITNTVNKIRNIRIRD